MLSREDIFFQKWNFNSNILNTNDSLDHHHTEQDMSRKFNRPSSLIFSVSVLKFAQSSRNNIGNKKMVFYKYELNVIIWKIRHGGHDQIHLASVTFTLDIYTVSLCYSVNIIRIHVRRRAALYRLKMLP